MHGYEKEYTTKPLTSKGHRQIHCILNHFDSGYTKLADLKDKKNCLKDIVDKSNHISRPLYKKFLNETKNTKMIDECKMFWLLDYNISYLNDKWDFRNEKYNYRNQHEDKIINLMILFFYNYFTKHVGLYRKYFNFGDVYDYLSDVFGEEGDEE